MRDAPLFATFLMLAACGRAELLPAADAQQVVPGYPAVVDQEAGLRVIADPKGWKGDLTVEDRLFPVELVIDNLSNQTVQFSRSDVALVGQRHSVRPLAPESIQRLKPLATTTGLPPDEIDFEGGDVTQLASMSRANQKEMKPAKEARALAIPEGPIAPGQRLRGFVYFDDLPPKGERLELRVPLRVAEAGNLITLSLPFRVGR